ncbi:hypothetical protein ABH926_002859 [Catenulispora sp. GP43]|uniref:hypothetical protein n=1 Tax=Catenulispora sp. GP43 TaxID=3156263 RepID=UPI003517504B
MSEPSPEQSFSIHLKSLTDFADEFTTQIQSLQAPMDHLATMGGTAPQYGAFHEAWALGAGEQAAVEEMFNLLGQVKTAIAFAGDVTGTVADGYRNADEGVAWGLGGPPGTVYGGGSGDNSWQNDNQYGNPGQQHQGDPNWPGGQNGQGNQPGPYNGPGPGVPNQNTSGPFASPVSAVTAVPLAGALLGGALLGGAAKSRSNQPPAGQGNGSNGSSTNVSVEVSFDSTSNASGGALPLWTPPPDPGSAAMPSAPAPAPVFPGQDAPWTATNPQGGS